MSSTVEGEIRGRQPGRCWVIVDPRLASDGLLAALRAALARSAVLNPVWREPSDDETCGQLASSAVAAQAVRVVVVGDQAMIRSVASGLANTGVPLGIVPIGSGRGLARSIGAPTNADDAIAVALGASRSVVDLMKVTIDGDRHTSSFVTVGIDDGADAGPGDLRRIGIVRLLRTGPADRSTFGATATVDRHRPTYSRSAACVIGIGSRVLSGEVPAANDQLLHLSMLRGSDRLGIRRAGNRTGQTVRRVVSTEHGPAGQRVLLVLDAIKPYYLDGALAGHATTVSAEIQPKALTILVDA